MVKIPVEEGWTVGYLQGDPEELASTLRAGLALAVSDGSYKDKLGIAGWILSSPHSKL